MLRIDNLVKSFPAEKRSRKRGKDSGSVEEAPSRVFAIDDVSFEVKEGELFTLLGPSGCGKTTTLRSVAGLERPDSGRITLGERRLFDGTATRGKGFAVPPNERGLGMVFQSYAIWPHMTVFENVAFPLRVRKRSQRMSAKAISQSVERVLDVMELDKYADRPATKLSGGQQQRLALARALVTEPPLLLLDEPLSNLDAKLRESLRFELKRLQLELGLTSIYVTHDQVEALALSSTIAVMRDGKVVQCGRPRDIYTKPNSQFVAEFIGTSSFLPGTVTVGSDGTLTAETPEGKLQLPASSAVRAGDEVIVSIRPEVVEVSATSADGTLPNEWIGEVITRSFLGDAVDHIIRIGDFEMRSRSNPTVSFAPGTKVFVQMDPEKLTLVPTS